MNTFTVVLFAVVACANAGLLGAPLAVPAATYSTSQLRLSQSVRPVAAVAAPVAHYAASPVAHYAASPAIAAPVAHYSPALGPVGLAAPVAHAVGIPHAAVAAAPIGSHIGYGYTALGQTLLG